MEYDTVGTRFNVPDFNRRWSDARLAALRVDGPDTTSSGSENPSPPGESDLLARFLARGASAVSGDAEAGKDMLLRRVFDNSRKLALSLSKRLGVTFEPSDFQNLLSGSPVPCFQGSWSSRNNARILGRGGCGFCTEAGAFACDYWREALDGLVMGLGESERLARHASVRHGDGECIDVFFTDAREGRSESLAWGPLPEHMALDLLETAAYFQHQKGIPIELKGFREGVLYFAFGASTDPLCGTAGLLARHFHDLIRDKFPGLLLKDVTPQAVLGTGAE
jgi:hypothetical protein